MKKTKRVIEQVTYEYTREEVETALNSKFRLLMNGKFTFAIDGSLKVEFNFAGSPIEVKP